MTRVGVVGRIISPIMSKTGEDVAETAYGALYGTNSNIKPRAELTEFPPMNEKPIYILNYTDMPTGHVAAFYDGERVDFYPKSIAKNSGDIAEMVKIVLGNETEKVFRSKSHEPENREDVVCYAIYPSQIGINSPEKIKEIMANIKNNTGQYHLYKNNCADQVIRIFEDAGLDMSDTRAPGTLDYPANVRNFARVNGYKVPYDCIPFDKETEPAMVYAIYRQRLEDRRDLQIQRELWEREYYSSLQSLNPAAARESTRTAMRLPRFTPSRCADLNKQR